VHTARIRQTQTQHETYSGSEMHYAMAAEAGEKPLPSPRKRGRKGIFGRHTITEGMVANEPAESSSLLSRIFRKRSKVRSPIPPYTSASVRSLRTSSESSPSQDTALNSATSCVDCVPTPMHKKRDWEQHSGRGRSSKMPDFSGCVELKKSD